MPGPEQDVWDAAVEMIGRTGASELAVNYSDKHEPAVWFAVARYHKGHEAAGAMAPLTALLRLLDALIDGGQCTHCQRPTGVAVEQGELPWNDAVCWYQYDPELKTFRRSCE